MIRSQYRDRLLEWARDAGPRYRDPRTGFCLIERDTCWYAASLLAGDDRQAIAEGNAILRSLESRDGTHTPATLVIILHALAERLESATTAHLVAQLQASLVPAAEVVARDGNVNHPLGAYCTLVLGGERCDAPWAVRLGFHRLAEFQRRIGDHRGRFRRQAEMSEYNSLTYTPLTLCFLAAIASYARDAEARSLALFLEERLWVDVAMHFHAPSQQFAGPHSRSYAEDSLGGFSALHCVTSAAFEEELFIDPTLPDRYAHPSNLFQNVLAALLPFHVPQEAHRIMFDKPYPYGFRMTTYGESYHENSRQMEGGSAAERRALMNGAAQAVSEAHRQERFAFDDEVYHGGWSELTTYMERSFAVGSALLPYVNAGHADSLMVRIARREPARSLADIRSGFTRGAFNGLLPGQAGTSHSSLTTLDGSFFIEEGRSAVYQHRNRVLICYAPKRTGHRGLSEYRTDFIWSYHDGFDLLAVDGREVQSFPATVPPGSAVTFRDGETLGAVIPFVPHPAPEDTPVLLHRVGDLLLLSCWNYRGEPISVSRDQLTGWRTGFYLELHGRTAFAGDEEFRAHVGSIAVHDRFETPTRRRVTVHGGGALLEMVVDPYREIVLSRCCDGEEEGTDHLEVEAAGSSIEPFCPRTLFGSELLP